MSSLATANDLAKQILNFRMDSSRRSETDLMEYKALNKQYEALCAERPGLEGQTNQPYSEDQLKKKIVSMLGADFELLPEVWGKDSRGHKGRIDFICCLSGLPNKNFSYFGIEVKAPKVSARPERFGVDVAYQAISYMDYTFERDEKEFVLDFCLIYPSLDVFFNIDYNATPLKMLLHRFRVGGLSSHRYQDFRFVFADDTAYYNGKSGLVNEGAVLNKIYSGNTNTKRG